MKDKGIELYKVLRKKTCKNHSIQSRINEALRQVRSSNSSGSHKNCFTGDTTILTKEGWKRFDELQGKELIATRNKKGFLEYSEINEIIALVHKGIVYSYNHPLQNFRSTPNHQFIDDYKGKLTKRKLESWIKRRVNIYSPILCEWKGNLENMLLSYYVRVYRNQTKIKTNKIIPPKLIRADYFAKLLAIYIAEGCIINYKYNKGIFLAISKKKNKDEFIKIIKEMGFNPSPSKNGITIYDKQLYTYFEQFGKAKDKFLPNWIKDNIPKIIECFLDIYSKCDGCNYDDKGFPRRRFYTISKKLAEDIQELIIKIGKSATIRLIKRDKMWIMGKLCNAQDLYSIDERKSKHKSFHKTRWIKEQFNGVVYCVNVTNNIILINKESPFWVGNCIRLNPSCSDDHNWEIVARCMEYLKTGTAFYTEVIFLNGQRADILVPAIPLIEEVMVTETEERLNKKNHPFRIKKVRI